MTPTTTDRTIHDDPSDLHGRLHRRPIADVGVDERVAPVVGHVAQVNQLALVDARLHLDNAVGELETFTREVKGDLLSIMYYVDNVVGSIPK